MIIPVLENDMHPIYKALFWCNERKDFFRWDEYINYFRAKNEE
jgi:hypothetical protein